MRFNIKKNISSKLEKNEVNIIVKVETDNVEIDKFIKYVKEYEKVKCYAMNGNELENIDIRDIIYFYSDKKYNYCKIAEKDFKVKSKLYEVEIISKNFIRISKSCVINIEKVKCFDLGKTGQITVKFMDNSEQIVSRRRIKNIMEYLNERSI